MTALDLLEPILFYYLTVSYNVHDLEMDEDSVLAGPFPDAVEREQALADDLCSRDLETTEVVNVSILKFEGGKLVKEHSFLASEDEYPPSYTNEDE